MFLFVGVAAAIIVVVTATSGNGTWSTEPNVLVVYANDPDGHMRQVADSVSAGAVGAGANVKAMEVSAANYKRDVSEWADALVLGSWTVNGNVHPSVLEFIDSFDFMDDMSNMVAGSFAIGGGSTAGLQPALEQINRGLMTFRMVLVGGSTWEAAEGTGIVTPDSSPIAASGADLGFARGQGARIASVAAALKASNPAPAPTPTPTPSKSSPPGWGDTWQASVSANLTQVGYDAGLVIVNFTAQCKGDPAEQKMKTVYGDFYTVLTRCDLGYEFTIAPASRGGACMSRRIGRDTPARICEACGCPFCVRDTNGTFTHGEHSSSLTQWGASTRQVISGVDVEVWTGRASSSSSSPDSWDDQSFDVETSVAYLPADTLTDAGSRVPAFVNVSHPLWIQTTARLDNFSSTVDLRVFDVPQSCYAAA